MHKSTGHHTKHTTRPSKRHGQTTWWLDLPKVNGVHPTGEDIRTSRSATKPREPEKMHGPRCRKGADEKV